MRASTLVVCIAIGTAPVLHSQTKALPSVIAAGLEAYKVNGAAAAVTRWMKNSPIPELSGATTEAFKQIERAYGRMGGYEILQVVPLGTYASRSYLVILYEKGPVYAWFDCYKAKDEWIMTSFLFNTKPDLILPPRLLNQ